MFGHDTDWLEAIELSEAMGNCPVLPNKAVNDSSTGGGERPERGDRDDPAVRQRGSAAVMSFGRFGQYMIM